MALTKKDIQIIKSLLKESADELRNEIKVDMKIVKTEIMRELRVEFLQTFNALKIYMDVEFRKIDHRFDRLEEIVSIHNRQIKELRKQVDMLI